jgi:hypothetical protein
MVYVPSGIQRQEGRGEGTFGTKNTPKHRYFEVFHNWKLKGKYSQYFPFV